MMIGRTAHALESRLPREGRSSTIPPDMRPPPKHLSCEPELIEKADRQAEIEGAGWKACQQCDVGGVWWRQRRSNPEKWDPFLCSDCRGYGWTYMLEHVKPQRLSVSQMAKRFDL